MRSSTSSIRVAMKGLVVSSGIVSAAVMLKLSVLPAILDFLPLGLSWMQPPYLYLFINCIILSIVVSSKLKHLRVEEETQVAPVEVLFGYDDKPPPLMPETATAAQEETQTVCHSDEFVVSRSIWTPPKRQVAIHKYSSPEKPPVSARFAHRNPVKPSPEGKTVLGVSRPKRQETLGSTWRTITDGRSMPLKRHLRKSETFVGTGDASPVRVMRKSETFARGNSSPGSGGSSVRLKGEASPSQDELNRRVEAFINKFNEEMRLQRQESFNQYRQMVGHRAD